jgi:hypothetical protein
MNTRYKDVIEWLENKSITDPEKTEQIIESNIQFVSTAFGKPYSYVDSLVYNKSYNELSPEENKIIEFYFKMYRRRMNL